MIQINDLAQRLIRMERPAPDRHPITRPAIVYDVPGVSRWLRAHSDGGWLQSSQTERDEVARRLLSLSFLCARGEVSDAC